MRYHIGKDGKQLGPFDGDVVRQQLDSGVLGYDDLIWAEGMPAWVPVRTVFPPQGASPVPLPGLPSAKPHPATTTQGGAYGNGSGGNPFVSAVTREESSGEPQLADRGKRLVAVILDSLLFVLLCAPGIAWMVNVFIAGEQSGGLPEDPMEMLTLISGPLLLILLPALILLIIQAVLLCRHGQTLGKRWMKIRIVRTDGSPVGFVHAILLRSFVMQMIGAIPVVGPLVSLVDPLLIFREDRRCLHDLIADTTVIDA